MRGNNRKLIIKLVEKIPEYKYVEIVTLSKKFKIKTLKKKFKKCIIVSNNAYIEKIDWIEIYNKEKRIMNFLTNLKLKYPIEKLPVFEI